MTKTHLLISKNLETSEKLADELSFFGFISERIDEQFPVLRVLDQPGLFKFPWAFSSQILPFCEVIPSETIANQVKKIKVSKNSRLHVFSLTHKYGIYVKGRAEIVKKELKKNAKIHEGESFVQVLIWPNKSLFVSTLWASEFEKYKSHLSPFSGGFVKISEDKNPPSRAYKKLLEAQKVLEKEIHCGEKVIDLGASPGGWTYIAKRRGASVVSVDRSPLRDDLMNSKKVNFIKGDAFKFTEKCDWLISDLAAYPLRVLELIDDWIVSKKCRNFVLTIKLQGKPDFESLKKIKLKMNQQRCLYFLRSLENNKNEVTLMGTLN